MRQRAVRSVKPQEDALQLPGMGPQTVGLCSPIVEILVSPALGLPRPPNPQRRRQSSAWLSSNSRINPVRDWPPFVNSSSSPSIACSRRTERVHFAPLSPSRRARAFAADIAEPLTLGLQRTGATSLPERISRPADTTADPGRPSSGVVVRKSHCTPTCTPGVQTGCPSLGITHSELGFCGGATQNRTVDLILIRDAPFGQLHVDACAALNGVTVVLRGR